MKKCPHSDSCAYFRQQINRENTVGFVKTWVINFHFHHFTCFIFMHAHVCFCLIAHNSVAPLACRLIIFHVCFTGVFNSPDRKSLMQQINAEHVRFLHAKNDIFCSRLCIIRGQTWKGKEKVCKSHKSP